MLRPVLSGSYFDPRQTILWAFLFLAVFGVSFLLLFKNARDRADTGNLEKILRTALAAAVVFRVIYPWIVGPKALVLADGYYDRARILYEGGGFSNLQSLQPTALEMPGYTLVLDGVFHLVGGPSIPAALTFQILSGLLLMAAIYAYTRVLYGSAAALWAAVILGFFPGEIVLTTFLQSDLFFEFCLWSGAAVLVLASRAPGSRGRFFGKIAAGIFFAGASLTRPYGFVFILFYLLWRFFAKRGHVHFRFREIFAVFGVVVVFQSVWVVRNFGVFHAFVPFTSGGGVNLWVANHPGATGKFGWLPGDYYALKTPAQEMALDRKYRAQALRYVEQKPWIFLRHIPSKWFFLFASDSTLLGQALSGIGVYNRFWKNFLGGLANGYYLAFFALAAGFCLPRFRALLADADRGFGLILAVFLLPVFSVFHVETRFHIPLLPALCVYSAAWMTGGRKAGQQEV